MIVRALSSLALCIAAPAAVAEAYVGFAVGANTSRDVVVASGSDDRVSICDEYINPRALLVPGCSAADRGSGDGWFAPFAPGRGLSAEMEFRLDLPNRFGIGVSYAFEATEFDQTVSSTDASGADFDKIANELSIGEETLGDVRSHQLLVTGLREWPSRRRWTPYFGVGLGVAQTRMDFSWLWARSADPRDIATGAGQPNEGEVRRNLAGTVSSGRKALRDVSAGWLLVAGVDRRISDDTSIGIKAQFKRFGVFESSPYQGDVLRSHAPNLRLDGSEPVNAWSETNDTGRFSLMLTVRHSLRLRD